MKKRIGSINPGESFDYGGQRFVVLEHMDDGVFCLLEQSSKSVPFNSGSDRPLNDYRKSTLRKEIEDTWLLNLIEQGAKTKDMVKFDVELCQTDRSEGYGRLEGIYAAPLTLWQYGKYKYIIPMNRYDWWLVTPWTCLERPNAQNALVGDAWYAHTKGFAVSSYCSTSRGVLPALKLNSELLVSLDGEDQEDADGGCDNLCVDLSRVDTLTLVREVERRLSDGVREILNLQSDGEECRNESRA